MKKNNLIDLIKNSVKVNNDLKKTMLDILISSIEEYNTLEDIKHFIENENICISGNVSGLLYYSETHSIFEKYYNEIFELYNDLKEEYELNFELTANNLVWFAYEELCRIWYYNFIENLEEVEE